MLTIDAPRCPGEQPGTAAPSGACLTIGTFDGLHRAHRFILEELKVSAVRHGVKAGIVTFEPSPQIVLHHDFPFILTPLAEKRARLEEAGMDFMYLIRFDDALRRTPAEVFLEAMVLQPLRPRLIIVGYDHHFGNERKGDAALLGSLKLKYVFDLRVLPEYRHNGGAVKSTRVRERLVLGAVRQAGELLGYRYQVSGQIVRGRGVGAQLGFATANVAVEPPEKLIPASGVYAAFARFNGDATRNPPALAVVNIGFRPTFAGESQTVEAHILDFEMRELYGERLALEFVERLRPEIKFGTVEELKAQISGDIALARMVLAESAESSGR